MRRFFILTLLVSVLVGIGGTTATPATPARAAEGDPGDYCSWSPDFPFGWDFNGACRGHDECLLDLPDTTLLPDRLGCDATFLQDLLHSAHLELGGVCEESRFCNLLANLYYRVVRAVSLVYSGELDLPSLPAARQSSP